MADDAEDRGSCWDLAMFFLAFGSLVPDGFLFWLFYEGGLCFSRSGCEPYPHRGVILFVLGGMMLSSACVAVLGFSSVGGRALEWRGAAYVFWWSLLILGHWLVLSIG